MGFDKAAPIGAADETAIPLHIMALVRRMALWSFTAREMGKWQGGAFLAIFQIKMKWKIMPVRISDFSGARAFLSALRPLSPDVGQI